MIWNVIIAIFLSVELVFTVLYFLAIIRATREIVVTGQVGRPGKRFGFRRR